MLARSVAGPGIGCSLVEGSAGAIDRFDRRIKARLLVGDVERVTIWDPDGTILYSNAFRRSREPCRAWWSPTATPWGGRAREQLLAGTGDIDVVGTAADGQQDGVMEGSRAVRPGESPLHPMAARQLLGARTDERGVALTPREHAVLEQLRDGVAHRRPLVSWPT